MADQGLRKKSIVDKHYGEFIGVKQVIRGIRYSAINEVTGQPMIMGDGEILWDISDDRKCNFFVMRYQKDTPIIRHRITWNYGVGANAWTFNNWSAPNTFIEGTTVSLPADKVATANITKELNYFTVNGVQSTQIDPTIDTDVVIAAVLQNKRYAITWTLENGGEFIDYDAPSKYEYSVGLPLPQSTKVKAPTGREFNYWILRQNGKIDIEHAIEISMSTIGDVEVIAFYLNKKYEITWELGNGSWDGTEGPYEYEYSIGIPTLPTNIIAPIGQKFNNWTIKGIPVNSISSTQIDPLTITANYKNLEYNIYYELDGGDWDGDEGSKTYEYSVGYTLPTNIIKDGYRFDHWEINGEVITQILVTDIGDKTIIAKYVEVI